MKCLYCHENVRPDGDTCPKCGLPLIEDTTLLEFRAEERPTLSDWVAEHRSVILAGVGGFAAAVAVGLIFITSTAPPKAADAALTPVAARQQPVQLSSAAPAGGGPAGAQPASMVSGARLSTPSPAQPAVIPEAGSRVEPAMTGFARAEASEITAPPPLPANFEHDPAWDFEPAPKPNRPRLPEPEDEPTPPQHVLAMNPFRERKPQYVIVVQQSVGGNSALADNGALPIQ